MKSPDDWSEKQTLEWQMKMQEMGQANAEERAKRAQGTVAAASAPASPIVVNNLSDLPPLKDGSTHYFRFHSTRLPSSRLPSSCSATVMVQNDDTVKVEITGSKDRIFIAD
ncbi:hypothetical protein [Prosthecobacter fusiformis]|nr:hypothetical protein [Prosthecobacter fusiformis]